MAKNTILVVDDDAESIEQLKNIFVNDAYVVKTCSNGKDALDYLTKNHKEVAAILLDLTMPVIDGGVLLRVLNTKGITKVIPVIMCTSERGKNRIQECYDNGAVDIIVKPFDSTLENGHIKNIIDMYQSRISLQSKLNEQTSKVKEQNEELKRYNDRLIEVMSTVVEFRNLESGDHIKRIKRMTRVIAEMCLRLYGEKYSLTPEKVNIIESVSALHDIGKIAISDTILLKPGRLTQDEFEVIKSHTTQGCEVLDQIKELQDEENGKICYNIVRHHHERYDGKGYPDNLVGDDIPIEAQIVSVVDAYEALVGERIYRDAFDKEKAYSMIMNGECGTFSEEILTCFDKCRTTLENLI